MRETLIYIGSNAIEQYIANHSISWHSRDLASRGGMGDQLGMPPTSSVSEFLFLLKQKQGLFTQSEYRDHCFCRWGEADARWKYLLQSEERRKGIEAKLFRNFYPSMIDSLHVYSLLVEAGWFDKCVLDSLNDAVGKHDIIVSRGEETPIALDLYFGSPAAISDRQYKQKHRQASNGIVCRAYDIPLPATRPTRKPGNKRWYCLKDFEKVYVERIQQSTLWDAFIVPCTCGYCVKVKKSA